MDYEDSKRVKSLIHFLSGYTSELSLEILATVDFILKKDETMTFDQVMDAIPKLSKRKYDLFKKELVEIAYNHLIQYRTEVFA